MQFTNVFVILFLVGTVVDFVINQLLEFIDYRSRIKNGTKVPEILKDYLDEPKLKETCEYKNAKYKAWIPNTVCALILSLALLFSGFYVWLFNLLWNWSSNAYVTVILFTILGELPASVLSIPFELYHEFGIEKKFGFSTMTFKLWIIDQIKELIVSVVLIAILLSVAVFLILHANNWWWILLSAFYIVFSVIVNIAYPLWIAPLFNKFTPLPEGDLKNRLVGIMEKTGFKADGIFVMDASKRSRHSNAYFTGFGKSKRVVLYDTLVEQMSGEEVEAVMGHELGHYKKHHIIKKLIISIPVMVACLFVVSIIVKNPAIYEGFGFTVQTAVNNAGKQIVSPYMQYVGFFFTAIVFSGYGVIVSLISNTASRKDEFEADMFSAKLCGNGKALSTALIKLNKENLSEVNPPKVYTVFNYNHPPLLERIDAIKDVK